MAKHGRGVRVHIRAPIARKHLSGRSISYGTLRHMRIESLSNVYPAALVSAGQMFYVDIKRSAQGSLLKVYRHHSMKRAKLRPVKNMILESH
ncbi:hypothetical protein CNYM01_12549 [Colletotrichum nymphaeae SA-01]|uniref:Uncharacterized protein n=1 Tax=Colletotrichum nymphaeae SA-01 TaxID=1460502 RepID=A0A135TGA5_9PEZI|nr:hypothetical protein CNYM01_12549 [Colletotrichum nymphaeae SA-01]